MQNKLCSKCFFRSRTSQNNSYCTCTVCSVMIPTNVILFITVCFPDLIVKLQRNFHQMLCSSQMIWSHIRNEQGPTITDRFSHSACYFHQSMYVFGGCSATSTTFNDLWRFDLSTRQWVRPLAMGRCHAATVTTVTQRQAFCWAEISDV